MIIKADPVATGGDTTVSARCPACRQLGTFELLGKDLMFSSQNPPVFVGHRRCPSTSCRTHLFVVLQGGKLLLSYPPARIDFDATNVPASVVAALEEAIICHANSCFTAAAIMVRKTLEELCRDRQAQGKDLKDRIRDLGTKIVLPQELVSGLDDLRLLRNDAAHIESREYDKVGKEEVEIGIEFTKEVLKATYQYSALLNRLRSLKRSSG
jgi:Domain of unknown function (DUF4145)